MSRIPLIPAIFLAFCLANASAQQPAADASSTFQIPSEPLLRPAPAFSQWTVTFTYPEDKKDKDSVNASDPAKPLPENLASRSRSIITTKTGSIIHEEFLTEGGTKTDDWEIDGVFFSKYPGVSHWSASTKLDQAAVPNRFAQPFMGLPDSGFRDLDFVMKGTYAGEIKKGSSGGTLVFVPGGRNTVDAGDPRKQKDLDSLKIIAYIDAETRLPEMVRAAGVTRVFKFTQPPPSGVQPLPPDLVEILKVRKQIQIKNDAVPRSEF